MTLSSHETCHISPHFKSHELETRFCLKKLQAHFEQNIQFLQCKKHCFVIVMALKHCIRVMRITIENYTTY